jgi:hypothetical protein
MFEIYTFICEPQECDALVEFHASDGFVFPNGEIKMKCPCGREMHFVGTTKEGWDMEPRLEDDIALGLDDDDEFYEPDRMWGDDE